MTSQESPPSRDRFKAACRAEFAFLVSDYGFTELPPEPTPYADPFKVRFVRDDLEVIIQGINYGQNVITTIQDGQGRAIWPLYLHPDFVPYTNPIPRASGQLNQIAQDAQWLHEHGRALLAGDRSVLYAALARYEAGRARYETALAERRRLPVAVEAAVAAFRAQEWARVVELLEPHEAELSPRMARKLATAREKLIA